MKTRLVSLAALLVAAAVLSACDADPAPQPPVEIVPDEDTPPEREPRDLDECPRADKLPCN